MKTNNVKRICVCALLCINYLFTNAQGVVVYKKDGGMIKVPYEQLDSISTYDYDEDPQADDFDNNGHEYIDLGLTSGLLWATCNVGASSPSDYGNYYAWGETTMKSTYTSSNYTYLNNPTTLPLDNDAARANWGGSWRMPTSGEFEELVNECTWTWTTMNSKKGYKVSSKKNGNYIFLPAAGWYDSLHNNAGSQGSYWSSTPDSDNTNIALALDCVSSRAFQMYFSKKSGRSVRPVIKK